MFENYYTTRMSSSKKALQKRFTKIRTKKSRFSGPAAALLTVLVFASILCATVAMAAYDGLVTANGTLFVNGKDTPIQIVHIQNSEHLYTDSYYVPLRTAFEALGCTVNYSVDRNTAPDAFQHTQNSFPEYAWEGKEKLVTDAVTMQIYGATDNTNQNMPIIEVLSPSGERWYGQIASRYFTKGYAPPLVLIEGTAYMPIRALAAYVDGDIEWDGAAHDSFYVGKLTWNPDEFSIVIDENAKSPYNYQNTQTALNSDGKKIVQRVENREYIFSLVENYDDTAGETFIIINKRTGETAAVEKLGEDIAPRIRIEFTDDPDEITLLLIQDSADYGLVPYRNYRVSDLKFSEVF